MATLLNTTLVQTTHGWVALPSLPTGAFGTQVRRPSKTGPADAGCGIRRDCVRPPFNVSQPPSFSSKPPNASIEALCRVASALGPVACAVAGMRGEAHWGDDLAIIRSVGLMQVGGEGVVSSALASGLSVIPVGGILLRLTLLNPLLAGLGAWLVFELALSLFPRREEHWLNPVVAMGAAWMTGMAAAWQEAATALGGPLLGACLVLLLVRTLQERPPQRSGYLFAVLAALLVCEARFALPPVLIGGLITIGLRNQLPSLLQVTTRGLLALGVVAVCLLPSITEPFGGADNWRLGLDLELPLAAPIQRPLAADVEGYPFVLAMLALVGLSLSARGRRLSIPIAAIALGAFLLDNAVNRLVLVALCATLSARGFRSGLAWVQQTRLPFRVLSVRLAVVFHLCAVLVVAEGGQQRVGTQTVSAVREWSEEAFDHLPAHSLLLVSSSQAAWRLWAARLTNGIRPDVVVVPSALLSHGSLAEQLLTIEPKLHRLIRDLAAEGAISEYALGELADTRPLRVEFDPAWTPRMLAHLVGDGLWFRFAPHAMGSSDRHAALATVERAVRRVERSALTRHGRDAATLERLGTDLFQHALVASVLGERRTAQRFFRRLKRMRPEDPHVVELQVALDEQPRGITNPERFLVRQTPPQATFAP